jgi:CBS domain containing-hemolysin-like protein
MGPDLLFTIFLVFLNGFFVAAEFAIVKVRISQIQVRTDNSFSARIAHSVVSNLDGYLAATQLGITLASLGLGWIGEEVVTDLILAAIYGLGMSLSEETAGQLAVPVAFVAITVLHIVFGELAPKSLAIRFPTKTTIAVSIPMKIFYFVFRPFIIVLNGFANFTLRLIGIEPVPHSEIHSEEELKLIIAESAEGGAIMASERELIQNVFDFDDRTVRQILKPRSQISALEIDTPLNEAIDFAITEGYSRFPVFENDLDNIRGFILVKDLLAQYRKPEADKQLRDMLRDITFVPSSKKISQVLRLFQKNSTQIGIVVNEFGGTVGLITLEDIIEELVGEIQDETDSEMPIVEKVSDNTYHIYAQNPIDEINTNLPAHFPESQNYVTLAGLILEYAETIPDKDQEIIILPFKVKVLKMLQNSPELIEASLIPAEEKREGENG